VFAGKCTLFNATAEEWQARSFRTDDAGRVQSPDHKYHSVLCSGL